MVRLKRVPSPPRADWMKQADHLGYHYYCNPDGSHAWREDVRYELDHAALSFISKTAETLHALCLRLIADVVRHPEGLDEFHIPSSMQNFVRDSWYRRDPFLVGRFDLAWCNGQLKLIEYNADTPATLPESTQMQSAWHLQRGQPHNQAPLDALTIIDRLTDLRRSGRIDQTIHIVPYPDNLEDAAHALFYERWATQAGLTAIHCDLNDLEVTTKGQLLHKGRIIRSMIRMYPWELMFRDSGARHLQQCGCTFLNPPWTALLSNKALLSALWKRNPGHPNLLAAGYTPKDALSDHHSAYVEKPIHARGGENIRILKKGKEIFAEGGTYSTYPKVYQAFADHRIDGVTASIGAWITGNRFSGLTMRESPDPIVRHTSPIVPHLVLKQRRFFDLFR